MNCSKTKIVVFSKGKFVTDNHSFKLSTENIEIVESYKYLGALFSCNGRFRKGEFELHQQAERTMYSLVGLCRTFDLPVDMQLELFTL